MNRVFTLTAVSTLLVCGRAVAQTCATEQVSFAPGGAWLNADSSMARVSASGRFVAFLTAANNTGVTTESFQIFVLDRATGVLELVSQSSTGEAASHQAQGYVPYIEPFQVSHDGRFVLFASDSGNLVPNDTNTPPPQSIQFTGLDVYLRDRQTGTTTTPNRMPDGTTGQGYTPFGAMSGDARWIAFATNNPIAANDVDQDWDVYLFDRTTGATTLEGLTATGGNPSGGVRLGGISLDGRYVVLTTEAANMVAGDGNGEMDAFVRDRVTGTVELISVDSQGVQANEPSGGGPISPDGRYVLFSSNATNWLGEAFPLPDLFVRDRVAGTTTLASARADGTPVDGFQGAASMSADGRYVLFESFLTGILPTDPFVKSDVFLRDLWSAQTTLVSAKPNGDFSAAHSYAGALSADGRTIVFTSNSGYLTNPPIANGVEDVFVRECVPNGPTVYCVAIPTSTGCAATISSTGIPSASAGTGFDLSLAPTRNQKAALFFYGLGGSTLRAFPGGWLCAIPPITRASLQDTGGSATGDDCTGLLQLDFNERIASGVDPALAAGQEVWAQAWTRDGGSPSGAHLSNALWFSIAP